MPSTAHARKTSPTPPEKGDEKGTEGIKSYMHLRLNPSVPFLPQTGQVIAEHPVGFLAARIVGLPQHPCRVHRGVAARAVLEVCQRPRSRARSKSRPNTEAAAVAPRHTITWGRTRAISPISQGRQAWMWRLSGRLCSRTLPRRSWWKCFTALVRYSWARSIPQFRQCAVQHLAGRSCERLPAQILGITGLLADHHHPRIGRPLPEHGLRGLLP